MTLKLAVAVVLAGVLSLTAQTRVTVRDAKGSSSQTGRVWVVLPNGQLSEADLDVSLTLDVSGARPVLKAAGTAAAVRGRTVIATPGPGQLSYVLPEAPAGGTLAVVRNGLELSEGPDYSIGADGRTLTFVAAAAPGTGDTLKFRYLY